MTFPQQIRNHAWLIFVIGLAIVLPIVEKAVELEIGRGYAFAQPQTAQSVRIGAILPLTGDSASWG